MEFRDHLLAPLGPMDEATRIARVDFGALVRRLLLFERYTIESIRLTEIPALVKVFGFDGLKLLLTSDALRIRCDALTIGEAGRTTTLQSRASKGALPLGSYSFVAVATANRREYIHDCMKNVESAPGLKDKQVKKLKQLLARVLVEPKANGYTAVHQLQADLETNVPVVKQAVALSLSKHIGRPIMLDDFAFHVHRLDETDFQTEHDITRRLSMSDEAAHEAVSQGLLGVGGLALRIEAMQAYNGVSGIQDDELPIFGAKLAFLAKDLDPAAQEGRFNRVLSLSGLPNPDEAEAGTINVERLLEVRDSDACKELRRWLRSTDAESDDDIKEQFSAVREALKRAVHGTAGRAVRFAVTTAVGLTPGVGLIAGPSAAALDSFLLEKVVPQPGPYSFLSRTYPSVFEGR
jgi:hypothetical protein